MSSTSGGPAGPSYGHLPPWEPGPDAAAHGAPTWGQPADSGAYGVAASPWRAPEYGPQDVPTPAWQSSFGQLPSQTAPRGARFGAAVLDGLILGVPTLILSFGALAAIAATPSSATARADLTTGLLMLLMLGSWLLPMIGAFVYFGYFEGVRGASLGKRMCGLRVVQVTSGQPIGFWQAVVRRLVLELAASVLLLGYLSIFFDSSGQDRGWHDMAADSRVVKA